MATAHRDQFAEVDAKGRGDAFSRSGNLLLFSAAISCSFRCYFAAAVAEKPRIPRPRPASPLLLCGIISDISRARGSRSSPRDAALAVWLGAENRTNQGG
jgi:hypothetical protein